MAVIAIVTSSPPRTEGGHLVIARELVRAVRDAGHDARLVVTPDHGFGRTFASYRDNWRWDVGAVDQVISLRYPSYAVRHPRHVCWLNHTMREYYDLWPRFSRSLSAANRVKEGVRRALLHAADGWLLSHHVTRVVAQSHTIQRRLEAELGLAVDVLWPPPPARAYRCAGYGDYFFTVSRLEPMKRIDLLVRALAEPSARRAKLVIAGDGPCRGELEALAARLDVAGRVSFLGRVDDETLLAHLAACRAVCFVPDDEDYGFVTAEAFASGKPVVTATDSGGPTELVRHEETGLVVEPSAVSLAAALERLLDDAALAERWGACAKARAADMTWAAAVQRLLMV